MADEVCSVTIGRITGPADLSPIAIQIKRGRRVMRIEMTPENFANAVTGVLVSATITREDPEDA